MHHARDPIPEGTRTIGFVVSRPEPDVGALAWPVMQASARRVEQPA
jgi:hypothetical protein